MRYVVYHGSREIYGDMAASAKSLLAHTSVDKVFFLIEDGQFPEPLPEIVETIDVSRTIPQIFHPRGPNYKSRWTPIGLARLALTWILPDIDKILSIDADTVVMRDIGDIWDIDMGGAYFMAAKEPILTGQRHMLYTNAGVTMFDLAALRQSEMDRAMVEELNSRRYTLVGQDVMNILCRGRIKELPSEYNACAYTEPCNAPRILHYAGRSDWRGEPEAAKWRVAAWPVN